MTTYPRETIPVTFEVAPAHLERVTAALSALIVDESILNFTVGIEQGPQPEDTFEEADESYYEWLVTDTGRMPVVTESLLSLHQALSNKSIATRLVNKLFLAGTTIDPRVSPYFVYQDMGDTSPRCFGLNARRLPELVTLLRVTSIKNLGRASIDYLDVYTQHLFRQNTDAPV